MITKSSLSITSDPRVLEVFKAYPDFAKKQMEFLRKIILETAEEIDDIDSIEETLKWGEPSYLTKRGSTIRMDWKAKNPNEYALYFKCTSKLVETFKIVFGDTFQYEGTRALIFQLEDKLPVSELKQCIRAALTYHKVKHLPNIGIKYSDNK